MFVYAFRISFRASVHFKKLAPSLQELKGLMKKHLDHPDFAKISKDIVAKLPPIDATTSFLQLRDYQAIAYQLNLKKDTEIINHMFKLILQDLDGNFVLFEKHIMLLIEQLKFPEVHPNLIKQVLLKTDEEQLACVKRILAKLRKAPFPIEIKDMSVDELYKYITLNNEVPRLQNPTLIDQLIERLQTQPSSQTNDNLILRLVVQGNIAKYSPLIDQHCQLLTDTTAAILLKRASELSPKNQLKLSEHISSYFKQLNLSTPTGLKTLNLFISSNANYFKNNSFELLSCALSTIDFSKLRAAQINTLLYVIATTRSFAYFKEKKAEIEACIKKIPVLNSNQLSSIFAHLIQIFQRLKDLDDGLLDHIIKNVDQQLDQFNPPELFLIFRSSLVCFERCSSILDKIEQKAKHGFFIKHPEQLINITANLTKLRQALVLPNVMYSVTVNEMNIGDWCNLVDQTFEIMDHNPNIQEVFQKNVKLRDHVKSKQLYYYLAASIHCKVDQQDYILSRLNEANVFQLVRILFFITQANSKEHRELAKAIIEKLRQKKRFMFEEFGFLDKGLLSFSLLTASLQDDLHFYEFIQQEYKQSIADLVEEIASEVHTLKREKQVGGYLAQKITNQTCFQLYQAFVFYESRVLVKLPQRQRLDDAIRLLSAQSQFNYSQLEFKVEEYLFSKGENFIRDYNEILPFRIDFYLPDKRVAIECNGASHYICSQLRKSDVYKKEILEQQHKIKVVVLSRLEDQHLSQILDKELGR